MGNENNWSFRSIFAVRKMVWFIDGFIKIFLKWGKLRSSLRILT
jgi:hypothetical protein